MYNTRIFISHRSTDKEVANMLFRFLTELGVEGKLIFCSSLPGNDIKTNISSEIKNAISNSTIDFVILSADYYESVYCLNEAGVIWFKTKDFLPEEKNTKVITIALPEITCERMLGFLNSDYKLKRLDNFNDIATICEIIIGDQISARSFSAASQRLIDDYKDYIINRKRPTFRFIGEEMKMIQSDAEKTILFYMLAFETFKVDIKTLLDWADDEEIYGINFKIGLELLKDKKLGNYEDDQNKVFSLNTTFFSELLSNKENHISQLRLFVEDHKKLSSETFEQMWNLNRFNDTDLLFLLYLIESKNQILPLDSANYIARYYSKKGLHISQLNFDDSINKFLKNKLLLKTKNDEVKIPLSFQSVINNFKYKNALDQIKQRYHIHNIITEFHK